MTVEYIRYFIEVCRCGSIQKAAKKLFISSQGLGQGIRRLESSVGQSLFERTQTGVTLTEFGKLFYEQACVVDREIARLDRLAESYGAGRGEQVVIGLVEKSKYFGWIQSCISDYCENGRAARVSFSIRLFKNGMDLIEALRGGEIGVGMLFHRTELEGIDYLTFGAYSRLVLLINRDDALASRKSVGLAELKDLRFITAGESDPFTSLIGHLCRDSGFEPNNAFYTTENTYIARLVDSGRAAILLREQYSASITQFCTEAAIVPIEPEELIADSIIVRSGEEGGASRGFAQYLFEFLKNN